MTILSLFDLMKALGKPQAVISKESAEELAGGRLDSRDRPRTGRHTSEDDSREMAIQRTGRQGNTENLTRNLSGPEFASSVGPKRGMILPFTPLAMTFDSVNYYVDMPVVSSLNPCPFFSKLVIS